MNRYIIQKSAGIFIIFLGIASALISKGDITASLLMIPLGLYSLFTKDIIIK